MNEIMMNMADRIAKKIRVAKVSMKHYENKRNCPFYSEWKGMEQALKTMGIDYDCEYNDDCEIVSVTVCGQTVAI